MRHLWLVRDSSEGVDGRRASQERAEFPENFSSLEDALRGVVADQLLVHIIVKGVRRQRESASNSRPEQVLLRRKVLEVRDEVFGHRFDAGMTWRRRRSRRLLREQG